MFSSEIFTDGMIIKTICTFYIDKMYNITYILNNIKRFGYLRYLAFRHIFSRINEYGGTAFSE